MRGFRSPGCTRWSLSTAGPPLRCTSWIFLSLWWQAKETNEKKGQRCKHQRRVAKNHCRCDVNKSVQQRWSGFEWQLLLLFLVVFSSVWKVWSCRRLELRWFLSHFQQGQWQRAEPGLSIPLPCASHRPSLILFPCCAVSQPPCSRPCFTFQWERVGRGFHLAGLLDFCCFLER